eukprot:2781650-Rhodomonas_salina.5
MVFETGFSYERSAIEKWLTHTHTDPTTNVKIARPAMLAPNHTLRHCITEMSDFEWHAIEEKTEKLRGQTFQALVAENQTSDTSTRESAFPPNSWDNESIYAVCVRAVVVASSFLFVFAADQIIGEVCSAVNLRGKGMHGITWLLSYQDWRKEPRQLLILFCAVVIPATCRLARYGIPGTDTADGAASKWLRTCSLL